MEWKVNTPSLLKETISNNPTAWALQKPFQIFGLILAEVAERASELNDPKLNALMCRLALYEISDPYNPAYDKELCEQTILKGDIKNKPNEKDI